jgi:hypothetical protein
LDALIDLDVTVLNDLVADLEALVTVVLTAAVVVVVETSGIISSSHSSTEKVSVAAVANEP